MLHTTRHKDACIESYRAAQWRSRIEGFYRYDHACCPPEPVRSDLYTAEIPDGTSLSAVLGDMPESVRAQIDGEVIPRERWAEPLPADAQVLITGTPEDDGLLASVAMIGVALASGGIGAWAAAGFSGATATAVQVGVSAAVTMAGSLAVNALIPPEMPSQQSPTQPNVRNSITGTQNRVDKYGVVPRVYGNPRWYPKLAANPVTEIAGNDQYLRMLLCLGYGPLEVAGHRVGEGHSVLKDADVGDAITIGETNLGDYEDVEWEIGMPDQLTLMTPDIAEEQVGVALNARVSHRLTPGCRMVIARLVPPRPAPRKSASTWCSPRVSSASTTTALDPAWMSSSRSNTARQARPPGRSRMATG